MRGIARGLVVVCVLVLALGVVASPRERQPRGGMIGKIVKMIRSFGDGLTVPGTSPAPKP